MKSFLLFLIVFVTITVNVMGLILMCFPDGSILNLTVTILNKTVFKDFQLPGIILTLTVGVSNLIALYFLIEKVNKKYNYALLAGWLLFFWCSTQLFFIREYISIAIFYLFIASSIILVSYQLKGKNLV